MKPLYSIFPLKAAQQKSGSLRRLEYHKKHRIKTNVISLVLFVFTMASRGQDQQTDYLE